MAGILNVGTSYFGRSLRKEQDAAAISLVTRDAFATLIFIRGPVSRNASLVEPYRVRIDSEHYCTYKI